MLLTVQRGGRVVEHGIIGGSGGVAVNQTKAFGPVSAYIQIETSPGPVELSLCSSFTSTKAAADNQRAELPRVSTEDSLFDAVASAAHRTWNSSLGSVLVPSASASDRTVLYTAMYHSLLHPRSFGDTGTGLHPAFDRSGPAMDPTPTVPLHWPRKEFFTDYSMWDVFRGQLPWLSLVLPRVQVSRCDTARPSPLPAV